MKSGLLRRMLFFVLLTLVINALLMAGVFTFTSRNVFANMKASEMIPRAEYISSLWSQVLLGEITQREFNIFTSFVMDRSMWDASVHVYLIEDEGWQVHRDFPADPQAITVLGEYLPALMEQGMDRVITTSDALGIVVGYPIYGVDAEALGAVFLTKPLHEVNMALSGLNAALLISIVLVFIVMLPASYIGSRGMANPLLQMSQAAQAMARGDFSVYAMANDKDEIGMLGQSLNELSKALSHTIGDLMLERNRLQNVLDGLYEGIVAVDSLGFATHTNPAALHLLGEHSASSERAVALLMELWPDFSAPAAGNSTQEDIRLGSHAQEESSVREGLTREGLRSRTVEVKGRQLLITVTDISAYDGRRGGAVAVIQDVTEQMRLEQTRRDYVANVSHELRTPIASIRSLADTLHDGLVKTEDDKHRYYGYILRESMRLSRLIDDLLELSRLQSGGVALNKRKFLLNDILIDLKERFEVAAGDSGLAFTLQTPPGALYACSNEDRVEQVLVALLDNAVKYASDDGAISLMVEDIESNWLITVSNTGHIGEEHIPHLFDRFYKADASHSGQGTGLGLAIAKEIMQQLGERIWAENIGDAACFHITLCKEACEQQAASNGQQPETNHEI